MKSAPTFTIRHFNDYHQIRSNTHKTIELGCFPVAKHGYGRYFGLFYKGQKPSVKAVLARMENKIVVGDFIYWGSDENIGISPAELREEITEALKSKADMPGSRY